MAYNYKPTKPEAKWLTSTRDAIMAHGSVREIFNYNYGQHSVCRAGL